MIKKSRNKYLVLLLSVLVSFVFLVSVSFDLLKALYEMYYDTSDIVEFFKEQGENVLRNEVRIEVFKLTVSRLVYVLIPISLGVFFCFLYHSKKLPDIIANNKIFDKNPSLSKMLIILRYIIAFGLAFLTLSYNHTFFTDAFHNCLLGVSGDLFRIYLAVLLFLVFVLDWKLFFADLKSFPRRHPVLLKMIFIFFLSTICCCLVELQIGSKMKMLVYMYHINIMYWLILQLIFFVLLRKVKPGAIVALVFSFTIGLANDIVYQFRGNYIMFGDLTVVRTALEVAGNYDYILTKWFYFSLFLLIVSLIIVILIPIDKKYSVCKDESESTSKNRFITTINKLFDNRIISSIIYLSMIAIFVFVTYRSGDFYGKVFGVGWNYNENVTAVGYLPYFISNMDSTRKVVLEDYSADKVKTIFEEYESHNSETVEKEYLYPNIILIQNEAFSDLSITADIDTDIDPMPFIHSLSENTEKGYLNMSVTGGPTSNTEFEVLSRASLQFFPYGSVPYTQYLKHNIPSLAEMLKNQGNPYHTVAYHSYYSSGYNRNSVYDYLGFDEKVFENSFLTDYPQSDLLRGYLSDEKNYEKVIKLFEDNKSIGKPFFCFNVTIQGHGGYTGGPYNYKNPVKVTNFEATDSINTYLSSIRLSDEAFEGLVDYFNNIDEPTIIFMYGDHQPSWDDQAKEILEDHPAWESTSAQELSKFYVPYILWANFDINEYDGLLGWNEKLVDDDLERNADNNGIRMNVLSTNYVGSYLLNKAGVELSTYDRFLLDLHDEVPAITAIGVWDSEGNYYSTAESYTASGKLKEYEMIQYNMLFDKTNKLTSFFLP